MRIFLDTNVLFSAAKSDGAVRRLLAMLRRAGHELRVDDYVAEEARRNIALKAPQSIGVLEELISGLGRVPTARGGAAIFDHLNLPEMDRPALASAILSGCEALVTGDATHFGALYGKRVQGVAIHSPRSIAAALL